MITITKKPTATPVPGFRPMIVEFRSSETNTTEANLAIFIANRNLDDFTTHVKLHPNKEGLYHIDLSYVAQKFLGLFRFEDEQPQAGNEVIDNRATANMTVSITILGSNYNETTILEIPDILRATTGLSTVLHIGKHTIYEGYPIDFSFFDGENGVHRIAPNNYQPLNGVHDMRIAYTAIAYVDNVYKHECGGYYLKWLNPLGGWDYYLFSDKVIAKVKTKDKGQIVAEKDNYPNSIPRTYSICKEAEESKIISSYVDTLNNFPFYIVQSPKVYLFVGEPSDATTANEWAEVQVKGKKTNIDYRKSKNLLQIEISRNNNVNYSL